MKSSKNGSKNLIQIKKIKQKTKKTPKTPCLAQKTYNHQQIDPNKEFIKIHQFHPKTGLKMGIIFDQNQGSQKGHRKQKNTKNPLFYTEYHRIPIESPYSSKKTTKTTQNTPKTPRIPPKTP